MKIILKYFIFIFSIITFHSQAYSQDKCEHDMPEIVCPGVSYLVTFPNVENTDFLGLLGNSVVQHSYFTKITYNTYSITIPTDYTASVIHVRPRINANNTPVIICPTHKLLVMNEGSITPGPNNTVTEYVACADSELNIIGGFGYSCHTCNGSWLLNGVDVTNQVNYDQTIDNNNNIVISNISLMLGSPNFYELCYQLESPDGLCYDEFCFNIEVPDISSDPSFEVVGGITEICTNQELVFLNTSDFTVLDPSVGSFVWEVSNSAGVPFASDNSTDFIFEFENTGTYEVELTYLIQGQDGGCVTNTVSQTVVVNPNEGVEITCPSVVCGGEEIDYTIADVDCSLYTWSNSLNAPATTSSDNCTYSVTWPEVNEFTIGAVVLELTDCTSGSCCPTIIDVPIFPTAMDIEGPTHLCQTDQTPITYMVDAIPGSFYNWTLLGPNGDVPLTDNSESSIDIVFPDNGNYTLTVNVDNPYASCDLTSSLDISNPKISGGRTICFGDVFNLLYVIDPNVSIEYEITDYTGFVFDSGIQNSMDPIVFDPPATGNYFLNIINGDDCFVPIVLSVVTVSNLLITGEEEVCPGNQYAYTGVCGPNESIIWNTPVNGVIDHSTDCSVTITWDLNETEFQVSGTKEKIVDDGVVCTADLVALNAEAIMPMLSISGNTPICYDVIETYTANEIPGAMYTWTISPSFMGSVVSGQFTSAADIQWLYSSAETMATVTCSVNQCSSVLTADFDVYFEEFDVQITSPLDICEGDPADVIVSGVNSPITSWDNLEWTLDGAPYDNPSATLSLLDLGPGLHTIGVTIQNPNGCIAYELLNTTVNVKPAPDPLFETFRGMCPKSAVTDRTVSVVNVNNATYKWSKNNVDLPDIGSSITLTPADLELSPLLITVEVTVDGCIFIISENLAYSCPDGDGNNPNGCPAFDISIDLLEFDDCNSIIFAGDMLINSEYQSWAMYYEYQTSLQSLEFNPEIFNLQGLNGAASLTSGPGLYTLLLSSQYCCQDDGVSLCNTFTAASLLLPFEQNFRYDIVCNSNNSYDLILNDASIYAPNNVDPSQIEYTWSVNGIQEAQGDGLTSLVLTGLTPDNSIDITLSMDGYGYGPNICPAVTQTIQIPALPDATIDISAIYNCVDEVITFDHGQENIVSVLWDFNDGSQSQLNPVTKIFSGTGTQQIDLTLTDEHGCSDSETNSIDIVDNTFTGNLTYSMEGDCNSMATLTFTADPDQVEIDQYDWSTGDITFPNDNSIMITQSDEYYVTVTDVSGCQHVFESGLIVLADAFGSDLTVTSEDCGAKTVNYVSVDGYSYVQYVSIDGVVTCDDASNFETAGSYIVTVYAFNVLDADCDSDINAACAMDVVTFDVVAEPPHPQLYQSSNCAEGSVTITINNYDPVYDVLWTGDNILPLYNEESITVFENGFYTATFIDMDTQCSKSTTIQVKGAAIDFDGMITGCYGFCEEGEFALPDIIAPPNYEAESNMEWTWLLDDMPISGATGYGDPSNLDLSSLTFDLNKEYKITFTVEVGGCTFESDPFCFTIEDCSMPDCLVYADGEACGYSPVDCAVSEEDGGPVYFINMDYYIPSGDDFDPPIPGLTLEYCGILPTITSNGTLTVSSIEQVYSDQLSVIGSFSVDDPALWSTEPISIQVIYCDQKMNLYCVEYQIDEVHCPNDPLECNVWFTGFTSGKEKGDDDNYYANYCVNLYNVNSKGCESTEWDIEGIIRSLDGTETTIYTESVSIAGEGDVYTHCFSVPIPNDFDVTQNPFIGFNITSNCPGIGCFHEFHNFGTESTSYNPVRGTAEKDCDFNRFEIDIPNERFIPFQRGNLFLNGNSIVLTNTVNELSGSIGEQGIDENLQQNLGVVEYQNDKGDYSILPVALDVELCPDKRSFQNEKIDIYPNPFTQSINITGDFNESSQITITDALGRVIDVDVQFSNKHIEVKFEEPVGIYFISIFESGNQIFFEKVLKVE